MHSAKKNDLRSEVLLWLVGFILAYFIMPNEYTIGVITTLSDHNEYRIIEYASFAFAFGIYIIHKYKLKDYPGMPKNNFLISLLIILIVISMAYLYLTIFPPIDFSKEVFIYHFLIYFSLSLFIAYLASGDIHIPLPSSE